MTLRHLEADGMHALHLPNRLTFRITDVREYAINRQFPATKFDTRIRRSNVVFVDSQGSIPFPNFYRLISGMTLRHLEDQMI